MNATDVFERIVSEHYEPLFRFALSLTRTEADAQDLTQQTFYIWATKGHQLRDLSKVKTWLFTTLHRGFLKARRRQNRFQHQELEEVADELPEFSGDTVEQADSSAVLAALGRVDEVYQAAVALFYLEDLSYKEIAAILEVPIGTVKSRIARGIGQLRQILLSESSPGSARKQDGIAPDARIEEPAVSLKSRLAHCHDHQELATWADESTGGGWGFGPVHVGEQFAAVSLINGTRSRSSLSPT